jgi:medium-chain acyl-[acyl-carrier-protein] hydrolase
MIRDKWFDVPRQVSQPALRFFCFPYAGGGARAYRGWSDALPPEIELRAVQLPGREARFKERPYDRLIDLVQDVGAAIAPHTDAPYAFFGHSMGALIAFTLARELRRMDLPAPELLMVSGHRAPQLPDPDSPIHALPEKEFLQEIRELNGTPEAVLQNAELLQLLIPILRADFAVCETYQYVAQVPLNCPIAVFGGTEDPDVSQEDLAAWFHQTTCSSSLRMFPGDHFYLLDQGNLLLQEISRQLIRIAAGADTAGRLRKQLSQAFPASI